MAKKPFLGPEIIAHFKMWDEIEAETDRGAAILAHAYLDNRLREALISMFVEKGRTAEELLEKGVLNSFEAKIKLLYCLGFFGKKLLQDLRRVNYVRNRFAHRHDPMQFDDTEIEKRCFGFNYNYYVGLTPPDPWGSRERYLMAVSMLANIIRHETIRSDRVYQPPKPTFPN